MSEQIKKPHKPHSLILDNKKNLSMTGINDVLGFDEQTINVTTDLGGLVIKGSGLHISKLNLESGDVVIDGDINSLQYINVGHSKSIKSKIFR